MLCICKSFINEMNLNIIIISACCWSKLRKSLVNFHIYSSLTVIVCFLKLKCSLVYMLWALNSIPI